MGWNQAKNALKHGYRLRRPFWDTMIFVEAQPIYMLDSFGDNVLKYNLRAWSKIYGFTPWFPCDSDKLAIDWQVYVDNQ